MAPKTKQKRNYAYWTEVYNQNNVIANTETPPTPITGTYSAWAPETVSGVGTETTPISTEGETGSGAGEYSAWADSSNDTDTTPTAEESGFAKWLEGNEEYKSAVAKAISEYDRNRATYGAQGEALARSGLVGSGYSAWADSQAYAQMQREKENARNVGYAAWLGEKENEKLKAEQDALALKNEQYNLSNLLNEKGKDEITDADINYYKSMGYSDEAIKAVQSNLATYKEQKAAEKNQAFTDSLAAFNSSGDAVAFLTANGVDASGMTDEQIGEEMQKLIDNSNLTPEQKSAHYRDVELVTTEFTIGKGYGEIGKELANKVETIADLYKAGKLTEADYNAVLQSIIDQIGGANVSVKWENNGEKGDDVVFKYNVNGKSYTITADNGGKYKVTNSDTLATLNAIYDAQSGTKSDVVYNPNNGKVYYYYADNNGKRMWTEIKAKFGNKGDNEMQDAYLEAIAAYMSRPGNVPRNAKQAS